MLRNFAAALLATTLIAGPAFAAQPSADVGSKPATVTTPAATTAPAPAKETSATKPVKTVKHARMHARHHVARAKIGKSRSMKVAQHAKVSHQRHAAHIAKPLNAGKGNKAST
jgi:hypothetical protein